MMMSLDDQRTDKRTVLTNSAESHLNRQRRKKEKEALRQREKEAFSKRQHMARGLVSAGKTNDIDD